MTDKFKPSVDKSVLLLLSGLMWVGVGTMLLYLSYSWLSVYKLDRALVFAVIGVVAALAIHRFGFLRIADRNLDRILDMEGKKCIFAFMPWKSYILVAIMATMGVLLRHSAIPKSYLSIIYIGIGLALILSSLRYLRVLCNYSGG
ncbi:MAG: hypothetical protein V1753_00440 [Pseudomonadota bacterium]